MDGSIFLKTAVGAEVDLQASCWFRIEDRITLVMTKNITCRLIHSGLFRDGSFRHIFSRWRIDQWVEVDRPAHAEGLRN